MNNNIQKRLKIFFDEIYLKNMSKQCLYYPIIKILSENSNWMKRSEIIERIINSYGQPFERGSLSLDHLWSQRFGKGNESELLNELIEHDGKNSGDRKEKYKIKEDVIAEVVNYFNEYPIKDDSIKNLIESRVAELNESKSMSLPRNVWVEKTYPGRRETGKEFSKVLFSPEKGSDGRDTYKLMRSVMPGDIVIHLIDNQIIIGTSVVEGDLETDLYEDNPNSEYFGKNCYSIKLTNYKELFHPIKKEEFLGSEIFREALTDILNTDYMVFYNKRFDLNQGSYITQAPLSLIQIFNSIYKKNHNLLLPNLESYGLKDMSSYWIFQCNPQVYNVTKALNDNAINEWWIKAHKEKIKIGDKGIIWVVGPNSGCYAFFTVTSEVFEKSEDESQRQYYQEEMKSVVSSKIGIKIDKNLSTNPILKESIKNNEWFRNFKGGTQGTTFTLSKQEYNEFLNITEKHSVPKHWMIGCGENGEYWEYFQTTNRIAIGWEKLGDHSKFKNRDEIELNYINKYNPERKPLNTTLCIWEFSNEIKKGDIVFVKEGRTHFLAAARIISSNVSYDNARPELQMFHTVEWILIKEHDQDSAVTQKSLTNIDKNIELVKNLRNIYGLSSILDMNEEKDKIGMKNKIPLNQILFGPPGTGKTYNSINKAIKIINPDFDVDQDDRKIIKKEYDRLVDAGQIVFTTFHQSMSYEDFIEGIKPIEPKRPGDPIIYRTMPGLFKLLCNEAQAIDEENMPIEELEFSKKYDAYVDFLKEKLANNEQVELASRSGGTVIVDKISDQDNIIIKHHDGTMTYAVSKYRLTKLNTSLPNLEELSSINRQFREIIGGSNSTAYWSVLNAIRNTQLKPPPKASKNNKSNSEKKYVLIIDEINRGNVSQIFGELITLIEDNKRMGQQEALQITLPYSKETFSVPSNVYIVGTMNTADRSVEALDTALRRRFSFEEIEPIPEKLENIVISDAPEINIKNILEKINQRIEKLLNKDHLIGHSFFINAENIDQLKRTFANNIIPLLKEYFYGDFGKIGLILGNDFIKLDINSTEKIFASFEGYEVDDLNYKPTYSFKDVNSMKNEEFKTALNNLLK